MEPWPLPPNWRWACFEDVAQVASNLVAPEAHPNHPHVAPNHIESGTGRLLEHATVAEDGVTSPKHLFRPGQILYSKIRPYLAKAVLVDFEGLCSADVYPVEARINSGFLHQWLVSPAFTEFASQNQGRTVLPKINQAALARLPVPVPPAAEQIRIANRLHQLKECAQSAQESLDAIPPLLDRFRQSVLAAAFRGDLTADWREKNEHMTLSSASDSDVLRQAPAGARRTGRLWGSGKTAVTIDPNWGPLPTSWTWRRLRELGEPDSVVQIGPMSMRSKEFSEAGVPVLNVGCVQWGRVDLSKCDYLPECLADKFDRYRIIEGDLLFTRSGTVGRCAVAPAEADGCLMTFHLLRVRPDNLLVLPDYLYFAVAGCSAVRSQIEASLFGATRAGFNTRLLEELFVPYAPVQEQVVMVQRVHDLLSRELEMRRILETVGQSLTALDQSILARAFRGELVPQDPNDEPASVLLERVRAGLGAIAGNGRRRPTRASHRSP